MQTLQIETRTDAMLDFALLLQKLELKSNLSQDKDGSYGRLDWKQTHDEA